MLVVPWTSVAGLEEEKEDLTGPSLDEVMDKELVVPDEVVTGQEMRIRLGFGEVGMAEVDGYSMLFLDGATGHHLVPGAPVMPFYGDMLRFPVNTKVHSVSIEEPVYYRIQMEEKVIPAPEPLPITFGSEPVPLYEGEVYSQDALFPAMEVDHRVTTGSGKWGGIEAHIFVSVFPLRYNAVTGDLVLMEEADLLIRYDLPEEDALARMRADEEYDILALCPEVFYNETLRYKVHKETLGWKVKVVSLDNVYDDSIFNTSDGRDDPERIKYFIKGALENWTIEHVVLVGDVDKFPIRRVRVEDIDGSNMPSDFYFGDIFEQGTTNFTDWNSDGDSYWGEARNSNKNADGADLDPDVTVGRLPASTLEELSGIINKSMSYDLNVSTEDANEWFQNGSWVGTDTFGGSSGGVSEGEYALETAAQYMTEFNLTKFYESNGAFNKADIEAHINKGVGFMYFSDHGSTGGVVWTSGGYGPGLSSTVALRLTNGHKLPLSIQDACSTNSLDTSDSLGENIVLNPDGGGIGAIGMTRIGWGMWDQWHIWGLSGYMGLHLIMHYNFGVVLPGQMLDETRRSYYVEAGMDTYIDFKTVTGYALIGDPVVFLGGPGITLVPDNTSMWADPGDTVTYEVEVRNWALHDDVVNISVQGGDWDWTVNTSGFNMSSNSSRYVTITTQVDDRAAAYSWDSVTLSVMSNSTPFPFEQELVTHVRAVRSVDFEVNGTEHSALPGENVTVELAIINDGNIFENASFVFRGLQDDWELDISEDNITVDPWDRYDGTINLTVPEDMLAANYYFELRVMTESNASETFIIRVTVGKVQGLYTYAIENPVPAVRKEGTTTGEAVFEILVENLGNHWDTFDIGSVGNADVDLAHPSELGLRPYANKTFEVVVSFWFHVDSEQLDAVLNITSGTDPNVTQEIVLTWTIERASSLRLTTPSGGKDAEEGEEVTFLFIVESDSNFDENVTLDFYQVPENWTLGTDVDHVLIEAYGRGTFNLSVQLPDKILAGNYLFEVVAIGNTKSNQWHAWIDVSRNRTFDISLDKDKASLYPANETGFALTLDNLGNCYDTYVISASGGRGLTTEVQVRSLDLDAWSNRTVDVTVWVPEGTPPGDHEVELEVTSLVDPTLSRTVKVTVVVQRRVLPDLEVEYDAESTVHATDGTGRFNIVVMNKGNMDEAVVLRYTNGPLDWTYSFNETFTMVPGEARIVEVMYTLPKGTKAGDHEIELYINSTSGTGAGPIDHRAHVLTTPEKGTQPTDDVGSTLSMLLIAIIIVLAILLVIALATRGRREEMPVGPLPPSTVQEDAPGPDTEGDTDDDDDVDQGSGEGTEEGEGEGEDGPEDGEEKEGPKAKEGEGEGEDRPEDEEEKKEDKEKTAEKE